VPGTDRVPVTAAQIHAVTAELDRELRRLHIARADRRAIVEEVRSDLAAAAADGVSPTTLIGPEVGAFAREAAEGRGHRPRPRQYRRAVLGGSLAAVLAAAAAYLLIVEVLTPLLSSWFDLGDHYPVAGPVVAFGGIALVAVLVTLAALRLLLTGRPAARETVRRAAVLVPLATAAGIGAAVAVGRDNGYAVGVVVVEALVIALPFACALAGARWWAMRQVGVGERPAAPAP
jgi:hypothetical protein